MLSEIKVFSSKDSHTIPDPLIKRSACSIGKAFFLMLLLKQSNYTKDTCDCGLAINKSVSSIWLSLMYAHRKTRNN